MNLGAVRPIRRYSVWKLQPRNIHGSNDYGVDPSQGLLMFQVLQAKHVPWNLQYFEAENHWVLKPADNSLGKKRWHARRLGPVRPSAQFRSERPD